MLNDLQAKLPELGGQFYAFVLEAVFAVVVALVARWFILWLLDRTSAVSDAWLEALKRRGVIRWGMALVAVEVLTTLGPTGLEGLAFFAYTERVLDAVLIVFGAHVVSRFLTAAVDVAEQSERVQRLPVKVFVQALRMAVWAYAGLMLVSTVLDRDVTSLLTGLTAVGALLVYVFRDYILGWNAALQIAANDLVQEGDWIIVKGHDADGHVADIGLTTVKIRNWDKSISVVPLYDIVSKGCRNMRFMYESGGRRIKRRFTVDGQRVKVCDEALLKRLQGDARVMKIFEETGLETMTNLGLLRRWLADWLAEHPDINHEMTCLVRELNDEGNGVVVEMYAFTVTTRWVEHERIKADVHDRVISELYRFDLGLYQRPGGADLAQLRSD